MQITKTSGILEDFVHVEEIKDLAEEIKVILSEAHFSASAQIIEINHKIGEAIVNHTAYQKGKHGSGELIKQLALITEKSEQHLYFCIKFYQEYPKVSNALETLQPDTKKLTWRQVVASLSDNDRPVCEHKETYEVKFICCRNCGSRIGKNERNKI